MILYLIRHGQTDWNREKKVMGREPVPLNRNGREGIALAARFLADQGIDRIFCGTLARTMESAEILASEWKVPVVSEPGLDESAFQRWVGKSYRELEPDPDFRMY
ncbi:MAG: histidine phosphatase family protein, partial [Candidatus Krumholzibacteriota bacterium]